MNQKEFLMGAKKYFEEQITATELEKSVTRANLTPTKIEDRYVECDVRLVAGRKQYVALPQDGRTSG